VFVVIDDDSFVQFIQAMHPGNKAIQQQAQACIACRVDIDPEPVFDGLSFQVEDCAAAVENMMLACAGLGYALSGLMDGSAESKGPKKSDN
jgi:hypothetical protein